MTQYDVVVCGARVAGAALALRLARAGARVCLLERASLPSPTISTHVLHTVAPLRELGVLDDVLAGGAPLLTETRFLIQGVRFTLRHPDDPGLCPRRETLDTALARAAEAAGADVRYGVRVLDVRRDKGAATGLTAERNGRTVELRAPIVVGADGRNSTVARAVGARRYLVTTAPRPALYGYFAGVTGYPPGMTWHRPGDHLVAGAPTDGGLFLVLAQPSPWAMPRLRPEDGDRLAELVGRASPELADLLAGARPVGEVRRMPAYQCYFRESAGPGWALLGDAGHFKDVTPGQGINDALRQAQRLAGAVLYGLNRPAHLNRALTAYWAWRDADARGIYWFGADLGAAGPLPELVVSMLADVTRRPAALRALHDVLAHRRDPSRVMAPGRLLRATLAALLSGPVPRGAVLRELAALAGTDLRRRVGAALRLADAPAAPVPARQAPLPEARSEAFAGRTG